MVTARDSCPPLHLTLHALRRRTRTPRPRPRPPWPLQLHASAARGSTHCRTPPRPRWALVARGLASLPALHGPRVRRWAGPGGQKMIPPPSDPPAPPEQTFLRHVPAAASGDPPPAISKAGKEKARPASSSDPPWRGPPPRPAAVSPPTGRGRGIAMRPWGNLGFRVFFTQRAVAVQVGLGREGDSDRCARHYQGYPVQRAKGKK